ncbi:hypothetical protein LINGRAHAP2_LOCUS14479, partial [Linum grandiflorum]
PHFPSIPPKSNPNRTPNALNFQPAAVLSYASEAMICSRIYIQLLYSRIFCLYILLLIINLVGNLSNLTCIHGKQLNIHGSPAIRA